MAVTLLVASMIAWVAAAAWWEIYDRIEAAHPRVILRDAFRQCLVGAIALVLFEFVLRLDLSRPFVALFAGSAWLLLCLFRLNAPSLLGAVRRELLSPHYVMVVGTGPAAERNAFTSS